ATFMPGGEGTYLLNVADDAGEVDHVIGWVMRYSPEYRQQGTNILPTLAGITGGDSLADDPAATFAHDLQAQTALTPVAPLLLLIALMLLPFDVAVRRLLVTRSDLARLRAALARRGAETAAAPSERLSSLMGAKARATQQIENA